MNRNETDKQPSPIDQAKAHFRERCVNYPAQTGLLATLAAWPHLMEQVAPTVPPEWFLTPAHRTIYQTMLAAHQLAQEHGTPPALDAISLSAVAKRLGMEQDFDAAVGKVREQINSVAQGCRPERLPEQIDHLKDAAARYHEAMALTEATFAIANKQVDRRTARQQAIDRLIRAATADASSTGIMRIGEGDLPNLAEDARAYRPTHMPLLADKCGGFAPGSLSLIVAPTGVGKSSFLGALALDAAVNHGIPSLTVSLEMSEPEVRWRHISALADIDSLDIERGRVFKDEQLHHRAQQANAKLRDAPFYLCDARTMTVEHIFNAIRAWHRAIASNDPHGRCLILFDHIKRPDSAPQHIPTWQVMSQIAEQLKKLAAELDAPIIAGAQANGQADGAGQAEFSSDAVNSFVGGAKAIKQPCDFVAFLRELTHEEATLVRQQLPARPHNDKHHDQNDLAFNQVLHVHKSRKAAKAKAGLPLYYRYGRASYREVGIATNDAGEHLRDERGFPIYSDEIQLLHSESFRKAAQPKAQTRRRVML